MRSPESSNRYIDVERVASPGQTGGESAESCAHGSPLACPTCIAVLHDLNGRVRGGADQRPGDGVQTAVVQSFQALISMKSKEVRSGAARWRSAGWARLPVEYDAAPSGSGIGVDEYLPQANDCCCNGKTTQKADCMSDEVVRPIPASLVRRKFGSCFCSQSERLLAAGV